MTQGNHIRCPLLPGRIHCTLNGSVELFAGLILHEAIDEVAVFVLEILGRGGGDGLGSGDTHKGDLHTIEFLHEIGGKHQLAVLIEVGADVGEAGFFRQLQEPIHTVVKLMVAGDGQVVAHGVHQVNERLAGGHGADGLSLDGIAVVHQNHIVASLFHALTDGRKPGIAEPLVNAAVYVAGKENHHILLEGGLFRFRADNTRQGQQHRHCQNQAENPFHLYIAPFHLV